jgi:hypothetical protein
MHHLQGRKKEHMEWLNWAIIYYGKSEAIIQEAHNIIDATKELFLDLKKIYNVARSKNSDQMQQPIKELLWLAHIARLWTHNVNSEK